MLTLLIEDARFPGETLQLVEVVVPMRQSTVVEGSWVDAMHIGQALQKGPAKIDGQFRIFYEVFRGLDLFNLRDYT